MGAGGPSAHVARRARSLDGPTVPGVVEPGTPLSHALTLEAQPPTLVYVMPRTPMPVPAAIEQEAPRRELVVTWTDGHASRYPYRALRQHCPCAVCVHEWTGARILDPERVSADIHPIEVARVGAYALRFTWSDGHTTGIYTFAMLRGLCGCEECTRKRAALAPPPSATE